MKNLSEICMQENDSIRNAIEIINNNDAHIALVVSSNTLIGTVTDGDIRRGLISNISLDESVDKVMNKQFLFQKKNFNQEKAFMLMKDKLLRHMPILDEDGSLIDLLLLDNFNKVKKLSNKVFILAGGKGRRLNELTRKIPKPMLPVNGKPILERIIQKCMKYGLNDFYLSVNYLKKSIIEYFGNGNKLGINITYIEENEPLGTAGSLSLIDDKLNKPLFVINGDVISDINFYELSEFHNDNKSDLTLCSHNITTSINYATLEIESTNVKGIHEKPEFINSINAGIYLVNPEIINSVKYNEYFDMTDLIEKSIKDKKNVKAFPIYEYWKDIGLKDTYYDVLLDIK